MFTPEVMIILILAIINVTQIYAYKHNRQYYISIPNKKSSSITISTSGSINTHNRYAMVSRKLSTRLKVKEKSSTDLFRKINYSNKEFNFEEILSPDDVVEYQKRFHDLMVLFPNILESDLRSMIFISPLLLALETKDLNKAVARLKYELPYVDPSYVIAQRSCGLNLLLSCMSDTFNLSASTSNVVDVIGRERNITEFLRRVPFSLTPRYKLTVRCV